MSDLPSYPSRIVAFVDILGSRAMISALAENPDLHKRIHDALTHIRHYRDLSHDKNTAQSKLEISVFSDSIGITAAEPDLHVVLWTCGFLQARLFYSGILTRGGIAIGRTFHADDVLYGEGVLRAYAIESGVAVYPRIVLDMEVAGRASANLKAQLLQKDSDGLWFVDPFKFAAIPGGAEELAADGYDPREVFLDEVRRHIKIALRTEREIGHIAKWNWLANRVAPAETIDSFRDAVTSGED